MNYPNNSKMPWFLARILRTLAIAILITPIVVGCFRLGLIQEQVFGTFRRVGELIFFSVCALFGTDYLKWYEARVNRNRKPESVRTANKAVVRAVSIWGNVTAVVLRSLLLSQEILIWMH